MKTKLRIGYPVMITNNSNTWYFGSEAACCLLIMHVVLGVTSPTAYYWIEGKNYTLKFVLIEEKSCATVTKHILDIGYNI